MNHSSLRTALVAFVLVPAPLVAQMPRMAPPPACRVSPEAERALASASPIRPPGSSAEGIAVLPFGLDTDDPSRIQIAWAVSQRVRSGLASLHRARVLTGGSVARAMVESDGLADSLSALLRARYVLAGTVEWVERRQRISAALYDVTKRDTVWRASFTSGWSLAGAADAIAGGAGHALGSTGAPRPVAGWPDDARAWEDMAAGDFALLSPTAAGADSAVTAYERARARAPRSTALMTRLARALVLLIERGGSRAGESRAATIARTGDLVAGALRADSGAAEAWTVRAMLARLVDPVAFKGAVAFHQRAIAASRSDPDAEEQFGITLMRLGDDRGAQEHLRRALALEPNRAAALAALAAVELRAKRWDAACAWGNASIAAWPYDPAPYAVRARARLRLAQARDAYADAELAARLSGGAWVEALNVLVQREAGSVEGSSAGARALTAKWLASGQTLAVRDALYLALAYQAVADTRRAVESLRRARPVGADLHTGIGDPGLEAIQSDTAVVRILRESASRAGQASASSRPSRATAPVAPGAPPD